MTNNAAQFRALCEARAKSYAAGEFDLHRAVDAMQADAVELGIVGLIGQDAVQSIMSAAMNSSAPLPVRRTIRVAWAPPGMDMNDLLLAEGPGAVAALIDAAGTFQAFMPPTAGEWRLR
jgi:hypothetical protein